MNKNIFFIFLSLTALVLSAKIDPFTDSMTGERFAPLAQFFSITGDGLVLSFICIFLFTLGMLSGKEHIKNSGISGFWAVLLSGLFVQLLKTAIERPRPSFSDTGFLLLLENPSIFDFSGRFNSFPSGHTAASFALAHVLSRSYPKLSPLFYLAATGVGFSRVYLGSHYPSDVAGGAILGTAVSIFLLSGARQHWKTALFTSLVLFIAFFKLGGLLLFDVDEAVFAEATREMVETGGYITPTYNYEPRYDKPILFYWLMAIAFKLFGVTEFSARFISAFSGASLVMATFFFVRRFYGERAGILAGLCLLLNLEFFVYSHSAVTDMTLTFFITAALYSFYTGFYPFYSGNPESANLNKWFLLFWVFVALASLTKGVIGLLFPAGIAFLYLLATGRMQVMKFLFDLRYILVFFIIAAPWYIAQLYINGWEFFNAFVVKHHFQRYAGVVSSHSGPLYYYLPVIIGGFFPWIALLPDAFYRCIKERGIYLFSGIWFLVIFVFFSLSGTKLPNYILPAFPAMAVAAGLSVEGFLKNGHERLWRYICFGFLIVTAAASAVMLLFVPLQVPAEIGVKNAFSLGMALCFLSIAVSGLAVIAGKRSLLPIGGIAAATAALLMLLRVYGVPPVNIYLQKRLHEYSVYAREHLGPDGVLATYEINQPSIVFYSERRILKLEGEQGLKEIADMADKRDILVIAKSKDVRELEVNAHLVLLRTDGRYALMTKVQHP